MLWRSLVIVPILLTATVWTRPVAEVAPAAARISITAHRGASAYAPENTMAALVEAESRGAHLFEVDVQQTRDRRLILMHDTTLERTTNAEEVFPERSPWRVRDFSLAEIRRLDAGSWFATAYRGERVPTLAAALRWMRRAGLGALIEVKAPHLYPGIGVRVSRLLRPHVGRAGPATPLPPVHVVSFDWRFLRTFHRMAPRVPVGLIGRPELGRLSGHLEFADMVNPHQNELTAGYVKRAHELGIKVYPWTIDDAAELRRAVRVGVDGVITDRPDIAARALWNGSNLS